MTLRIGSVCTGYGGLDLAAEAWFGGSTVWTSDIDPGASKIIAHRFPHAPNLGDFTILDWSGVPSIDIFTAGYPCQPFSLAGRRKGTNDVRHLWPYVRDAIRHLRPRYTFLENVAGHRSMGFDRVLGDLAEDGLHARWVSVRASDAGAPHERERVFIVAADPDLVGCSRRTTGPGVQTSGGAFAETAGPGHRLPTDADRELVRLQPLPEPRSGAQTIIGRDSTSPADTTPHRSVRLPDGTSSPEACGGRQRDSAGDDRLHTAAHSEGKRRRTRRTQPERVPRRPDPDQCRAQDWGRYEPAIRRWEHVIGRDAPRPVEQTQRGAWRLSPWFDEWLMGLPEGWLCDVPDLGWNEVLSAAGNGVVPQAAYEALRQVFA